MVKIDLLAIASSGSLALSNAKYEATFIRTVSTQQATRCCGRGRTSHWCREIRQDQCNPTARLATRSSPVPKLRISDRRMFGDLESCLFGGNARMARILSCTGRRQAKFHQFEDQGRSEQFVFRKPTTAEYSPIYCTDLHPIHNCFEVRTDPRSR